MILFGWGAYKKEITKKALSKNIYSVSVYDDKRIIGYGRILGDGIIFLYIQDVMVVPSFQRKGIGTQIMNRLLDKVKQLKEENPNLRVYVGAEKGKEGFYEKFGFIARKDFNLGEGMILK